MPDDLANLCALLRLARGRAIREADLLRRLRGSLRIDSDVHPEEIVGEGLLCGLVEADNGSLFPTSTGKAVGKAQQQIQSSINFAAQDVLVRKVYLSHESRERCCGRFFEGWEVDVERSTFTLRRHDGESHETLEWLQTLQRVGLIVVDSERAFLNRDYLGAVNELLAKMRGITEPPDPEGEKLRQQIGNLGEELAVAFEKERLRRRGLDWLQPAVKRISLIDNSAGYDVVSCQGSAQFPDRPTYIEVKATTSSEVQFFWSRNERRVAERKGADYWLYVYTGVDLAAKTARGPVRIRNPNSTITSPAYDIEPHDVFVRKA